MALSGSLGSRAKPTNQSHRPSGTDESREPVFPPIFSALYLLLLKRVLKLFLAVPMRTTSPMIERKSRAVSGETSVYFSCSRGSYMVLPPFSTCLIIYGECTVPAAHTAPAMSAPWSGDSVVDAVNPQATSAMLYASDGGMNMEESARRSLSKR